jgi:cation diffusion facilitator CzcD-associated flavoprotein CzcO
VTSPTDTAAADGARPPAERGDVEHVDVLVVGAGLSGIGAGLRLQASCPWASYAIFEARDAIGGTWDLFRYPGVRSDSDMFTLGYELRPWPRGESIADGATILEYIRDTARESGVDAHIRFRHRIVRADWSTPDARWTVTAERTDTGEVVRITAGFLFSCSGYYRYDQGYTPDLPGRDRFGGTIVHPQAWPADLDHAGKRIVVIGSGATAITLVPALAETAGHVTMLQRSPTYVASMPAANPLVGVLRRVLPRRRADRVIRWVNALGMQAFYQISQARPGLVKRILRRGVVRQLPEGYDVDTHFTPRYDPWDERLCLAADGDLFRAIREGRASVVTDTIETFTEGGIRLSGGDEIEADVIVTATGLDLLFLGGIAVTVDGEDPKLTERLTYKGMMIEGVPNLAIAIGYTNASWTLKCDLTCDHVCRMLNHMRRTGLRQATPVNADPDITGEPLLGLRSGYLLRAVDRFPKQGSRPPWRVYQSYLRDYRALRMRGPEDEAMVFSNPLPAPAPAVPAAS